MNIQRNEHKVRADIWARYRHNLTTPLGEDGRRLTGCPTHIALSRRAAGEGMVLLENDGTLPLREGARVALFGIGSLDYVKGGGGSGQVYSAYVRNVYEGLLEKAPRVTVYEPLTRYYYDYCTAHLAEYPGDKIFPEIDLPESLVAEAAEHADVAVLTLHRYSGEEMDRTEQPGDFMLSDSEQRLVHQVTTAFSHTVVVLDVGGMVDLSWIKDNPRIGAVLLAWQAGMEGGCAIADILCGNVNPSGKLTDTFARSFGDYPSANTFNESADYVEYFEDIYVGYRYFETIPGAKERVVYPFGYGLSYTTFSMSPPQGRAEGDCIHLTTTVTNTGDRAGKEVVQGYVSAPQGRLGKPAVSLIAFEKTRLLQPGESQRVELTVPVADLASYDDVGRWQASAYILKGGDYRFYVGNSCRDGQETPYRYTVEEDYRVVRQLTRQCAPAKDSRRLRADGSFEPLPGCPVPQIEPTVSAVSITPPPQPHSLASVAVGNTDLPTFLSQLTEEELIGLMGGIPNRGVANTCGFGGIDRLGVPAFMTVDGPAGVRIGTSAGIATTAWPCATLLACTWNLSLMEEIGRAGALETRENGLAIWLTPAINIHRNPLCGRNFEYFSEDPLIAGRFAAAKVRGIQSVKVACSLKHFACNNKEHNRYHSDSRLSERALREIYLRGFEICVKEADPWTVMTSYNLVNSRRCCESYELITGILREEWGFRGAVTSDWGVPCYHPNLVKAGNDVRMPVGKPEELRAALHSGELTRGQLEACAAHLLDMMTKIR